MKQTTVEYLVNQFRDAIGDSIINVMTDEIEQAKEMEKEQHDVTFAAGYDYRSSKEKNIIEAFGMNSKPTFEQYYNETFKK